MRRKLRRFGSSRQTSLTGPTYRTFFMKFYGHSNHTLLKKPHFMSRMRIAEGLILMGLAATLSCFGTSPVNLPPQGGEFAIAGHLPGDQVRAQAALSASGGFIVFQDNATDGDGLGISAQLLDGSFSNTLGAFRVNEIGIGDQENPQVALLSKGGTVFVWQGGVSGFQKIYARYLTPTNTFATRDILVNSYTNNQQINPVVSALPDGNVLVAWSSDGQDGDMLGIFARRLSSSGAPLGAEFQVNQFSSFNQRNPALAVLNNGNVAISWISEQQQFARSVNVYGRLFKITGEPIGNEFLVDTLTSSTNICASPALCGATNGGFTVVWAQKDLSQSAHGWEVLARPFNANGKPLSNPLPVNTFTTGDQYAPKVAAVGANYLVTWTSVAQDGDREGVFAQYFSSDSTGLQPIGNEFGVNTTVISQQLYPTVASDGLNRFMVVWSSFVGGASSFDLYAQRYAIGQALTQPSPPYISALNSRQLSVTWPPLAGLPLDHYELLMDASTAPVVLTNNQWTADNLAMSSTHSFRLAYQLSNGLRSPWSDPASGNTWGLARNDGLPFDWLIKYYSNDSTQWPAANADTDGDQATTLEEFLAGTNPTDSMSSLRLQLLSTSQGWRLSWITQPGFIYQVQFSPNVNTWTNLGVPRFAAGVSDSVPVDGANSVAYYRIIRIR